ncbi:Zinc finger protein [Ceratobasidium sp. AG-Ba]|nr:Zinc finger protein [Ceratobasidium sp. AG-Ba]
MLRPPANLTRLFATIRPKRLLGSTAKESVADASAVAIAHKQADQTSVEEWLSSAPSCPRLYTQRSINGPALALLTASVHKIYFYLEGKREYLLLDLFFTPSPTQKPFVVYCCIEPAAMPKGSSDFGGSVRFDARPWRLHTESSSKLIGYYEYEASTAGVFQLSLCQILGMCAKYSSVPQRATAGSSELYCLSIPLLREELLRYPSQWFETDSVEAYTPNSGQEGHCHGTLATGGSCMDLTCLKSKEVQCPKYLQPTVSVRAEHDPLRALSCTKRCASYYNSSSGTFLSNCTPCLGCDTLPIYDERPDLSTDTGTGPDKICSSLRPDDKDIKELSGHGDTDAEISLGTPQGALDSCCPLENDTLDVMDHEPNSSVGIADSSPFAANIEVNPPGPSSLACIPALSEEACPTKDEVKGMVFIKQESQEDETKDHSNNVNADLKEPFSFTAKVPDDSMQDLVQEVQPQHLKCVHSLTIDSGCVEGTRTVRQIYSRLPISHCEKRTLRLYRFQYSWQRPGRVKHKLFGLCLSDFPVLDPRKLPPLPTGKPCDYSEADAWINHGDLGWDAFPNNRDALGFSMDLNLSSSLNQMGSHSWHDNSNAIRSGQGPGNHSIDVQDNDSTPDLHTLAYWARRRGYQLIQARHDGLSSYPPRVSNLQPRPPVPLSSGLSSSTTGIDTSRNIYENTSESLGSPPWSIGNIWHPEPMFISVGPSLAWSGPPPDIGLCLLPRHEPSASQLCQDPGFGKTESGSVFSTLPILPEGVPNLETIGPSHAVPQTRCDRDQGAAVPAMVDHDPPGALPAQVGMMHTSDHDQAIMPVRNTTRPIRTGPKFPCQQ